MTKKKFKIPKGIPLKSFENMTIMEIRKIDKEYRKIVRI